MNGASANKPKYQIISEDLINKIQKNEFSYNEPICTEKQLAEQYGVSRITSKHAINDLEAMGILYRKRGVGSFVSHHAAVILKNLSIARTSSRVVAVLLPFEIAKSKFMDTIEVLHKELHKEGFFLNLCISEPSSKKEKKHLSTLLSQHISALVYFPFRDNVNLPLLNEFVMNNVPVIIVDKSIDCPYIHNVAVDNLEGGRLLTKHLISLGHRNICYLTTVPIETTSSVRNRFGGYLEQLHAEGIIGTSKNLVEYLEPIDNDELAVNKNHPFVTVIRELYQRGVTAIIAEHDLVAYSIKLCCRHLNIRVPEDLSICGFDDIPIAQTQSLTTVVQNFTGMGVEISRILIQALYSPTIPTQKVALPVELVVRGSTDMPRTLRESSSDSFFH